MLASMKLITILHSVVSISFYLSLRAFQPKSTGVWVTMSIKVLKILFGCYLARNSRQMLSSLCQSDSVIQIPIPPTFIEGFSPKTFWYWLAASLFLGWPGLMFTGNSFWLLAVPLAITTAGLVLHLTPSVQPAVSLMQQLWRQFGPVSFRPQALGRYIGKSE